MREQRRLTLKYACGTLNRCRLGLSFLGFREFPGRLLLTDRSRRRFVRKIGAYDLALADGLMTEYWIFPSTQTKDGRFFYCSGTPRPTRPARLECGELAPLWLPRPGSAN